MQNQSPSTPQSDSSSATANAKATSSPLAEATIGSLDELINRTPDISDAEADKIIEYLRAQRAKFAQQEAAPKPKKTPRQKGPVLTADDILGALE